VQENAKKRAVDVDTPIVLNETEFPEFIHENIYPRTGRANHFG
jgi:hypothetical protein